MKFTRDKFKGTAALKKKDQSNAGPHREEREHPMVENLKQSTELLDDPGRCIHIGDRESDT